MERCSKQRDKQAHCFLIVKQASSHVAKNATCYGILHPAYQLVIMGAEEPKLDVDFIEQFYASTEERSRYQDHPCIARQLSFRVKGESSLTAIPESSVSVKTKKGCLQTDLLSSSSRAPQTGGILNVFHLKIILLSHQRKTPCLHRVNLLQPRRYYISCLRSNRSMVDWPRSQCPPSPASTLKLRRLENVVLYFCMYCTVVPYSTVHTSRNW